jgi:hypothetical protein
MATEEFGDSHISVFVLEQRTRLIELNIKKVKDIQQAGFPDGHPL